MPVYSAQEVATLQSRLEKQLGPEYISSRQGPGGKKVHYLASEKAINLANEVFGFNGWSSSIRDVQVDFVDESSQSGKVSMGLSVIVRVTLKDGAYHEDMGYGHIENCRDKAAAFEKAKKEAVSDARKRALRNFGNVLGNCIYDKEYLDKVTKVKAEPTKFSTDTLHRNSHNPTIKKEPGPGISIVTAPRTVTQGRSQDAEDEFGTADFDDADFSVANGDHPDEISLDPKPAQISKPNSPIKHMTNGQAQRPNINPNHIINQPTNTRPPPIVTNGSHGASANKPPSLQQPANMRPGQVPIGNAQRSMSGPVPAHTSLNEAQFIPAQRHQQPTVQNTTSLGPPQGTPPNNRSSGSGVTSASTDSAHADGDAPVGFFTARAAETLQHGNKAPPDNAVFNPRLESPSIRKTAGVDHSSSKPISRDLTPVLSVPGSGPGPMAVPRNSFVNPHTDPNRRVGMPSAGSPLQNRSTFRQPQMKRPADAAINIRPALNDVTNASVNAPTGGGGGGGGDGKRQRVGDGPVQDQGNATT